MAQKRQIRLGPAGWGRAAVRTVALAGMLLATFFVAAVPPAAAAGTVGLASAIALVTHELAAVGAAGGSAGRTDRALLVEDAQLDLTLVEVAGRAGADASRGGDLHLAVPAVEVAAVPGPGRDAAKDTGTNRGREVVRDAASKPVLRHHLTLDLQVARPRPAGANTDPKAGAKSDAGPEGRADSPANSPADLPADEATPLPRAPGPLVRALLEIADATADATAALPAIEARRLSIDLDIAFGRDAHGGPVLIVFAADRPLDPRTVHKLRLRLVTPDRLRAPGRTAGREPARDLANSDSAKQ